MTDVSGSALPDLKPPADQRAPDTHLSVSDTCHQNELSVLETFETHVGDSQLDEAEKFVQKNDEIVLRHTMRFIDSVFTRFIDTSDAHSAKCRNSVYNGTARTYIDEKVGRSNVERISCCTARLLGAICRRANRKEALICLLEKTELYRGNDSCFFVVLQPLKTLLLQWIGDGTQRGSSQGMTSLLWTLNTLYSHLTALPSPPPCPTKNFPHPVSADEQRQMELQELVRRPTRLLERLIEFLQPFVTLTALNNHSASRPKCGLRSFRRKLVCFLLRCCGQTLLPLDVHHLAVVRRVAEQLMNCVSRIHADYVRLLPLLALSSASGCSGASSIASCFSTVDQCSRDAVSGDDDEDEDDTLWPSGGVALSVSVFLHLLLTEQLALCSAPAVYSPQFVVRSVLPAAVLLLRRKQPAAADKGLALTSALLARLSIECLPLSQLDDTVYRDLCAALLNVAVFGCGDNSGEDSGIDAAGVEHNELRSGCVVQLTQLFYRFKLRPRCRLLLQMLNSNHSATVLAYLTDQVRDNLSLVLRRNFLQSVAQGSAVDPQQQRLPIDHQPQSGCVTGDDDGDDDRICWFLSPHVDQLVLSCCRLPAGTHTDLLDNHAHITSALSLLRFICLSLLKYCRSGRPDSADVINTHSLFARLRREYLEPLRQTLQVSRDHFELRLAELLSAEDDGDGSMVTPSALSRNTAGGQAVDMSRNSGGDANDERERINVTVLNDLDPCDDGTDGVTSQSRYLTDLQQSETIRLALTTLDLLASSLTWLHQAIADLDSLLASTKLK